MVVVVGARVAAIIFSYYFKYLQALKTNCIFMVFGAFLGPKITTYRTY